MRIHREGFKVLGILFLILAAINCAVCYWIPKPEIWLVTSIIISMVLWFTVAAFFRIPSRKMLSDELKFMAAADGTIVAIEEVEESEYFKAPRKLVSIFMSVRNAHVNRNPIAGTVKYLKYHPGKFLVAWHPKSSTDNERTTIVLENARFDVLIRQIAGAVARRIKYYLKEGQKVEQNEELGFIKFGSRVDMYLPLDADVLVSLKEKVKAGLTTIAKMPS